MNPDLSKFQEAAAFSPERRKEWLRGYLAYGYSPFEPTVRAPSDAHNPPDPDVYLVSVVGDDSVSRVFGDAAMELFLDIKLTGPLHEFSDSELLESVLWILAAFSTSEPERAIVVLDRHLEALSEPSVEGRENLYHCVFSALVGQLRFVSDPETFGWLMPPILARARSEGWNGNMWATIALADPKQGLLHLRSYLKSNGLEKSQMVISSTARMLAFVVKKDQISREEVLRALGDLGRTDIIERFEAECASAIET